MQCIFSTLDIEAFIELIHFLLVYATYFPSLVFESLHSGEDAWGGFGWQGLKRNGNHCFKLLKNMLETATFIFLLLKFFVYIQS